MTQYTSQADYDFVLSRMHYYQEHPTKSQRFMDMFPILSSPRATEIVISDLAAHIRSKFDVEKEVNAIVGPEAEGFLFGALIAARLGLPFIPARKQTKLPGDVLQQKYSKWAGSGVMEMQRTAFAELDNRKGAIIVDDSVASGGSAGGVKRLIERLGIKVLSGVFVFVTDTPEHCKNQRQVLGDVPLYGMIEISEDVLSSMHVYQGKKDKDGNYTGDAGLDAEEPEAFTAY